MLGPESRRNCGRLKFEPGFRETGERIRTRSEGTALKNIRIWESLFVNRRAIHKQGTFEAIYESFNTFNFGQDDFSVLKNDLEKRFLKVPNTDLCSHMKQILLKLLLKE